MPANSLMLMGAGQSGSSAAAFVPTDIAGLQFWVKSDTGITKDGGDLVSQWDDQAGSARHLTEATNKMLWVDNQLNGKPIIRGDGVNDKMSTGLFDVAQPATWFAVFKITTHTSGAGIVGGVAAVSCGIILRGSPLVHVIDENVGDGASVNSPGAVFALYKGIFNGASSVIALNDGADQTAAPNFTSAAPNDGVFLGGRSGGSGFGNFDVAEILIYNSVISGANLTSVKNYLNTRYALW